MRCDAGKKKQAGKYIQIKSIIPDPEADPGFLPSMEYLKGETVRVLDITPKGYYVVDEHWHWSILPDWVETIVIYEFNEEEET